MKRTDLAYIAGVFDGEGCIHISKQAGKAYRYGYIFRLIVTL